VEKLWTKRAFPVDRARIEIYFAPDASGISARPDCARGFVARFACAGRRSA
jgi:hypothetical protein